jgi:hypothetical protein
MDSVTTPDAAPPVYLPYPPPPPPPPSNPRVRRALIAVAAAWGLLLAVSGIWYSWHGRPTDRDQTTVARAEPVVAQAIADVVRAAGGSVVPALSGFEKTGDCSVTPVRDGAEYQRVVRLYTPAGGEPAVLDRIARGLPARYRAVARHSAGGAVHTFSADAGYYVAVTGTVERAGLVAVQARTGCRPLGQRPAADPGASPGENPLGVNGSWQLHALPCGLRTLAVTGPASRTLSTLPETGAVVRTADVWAAPDGRAARFDAGAVTWTITSGSC